MGEGNAPTHDRIIEKYNGFLLLNPHLFAIAVIENSNGYREHDIMRALNKNQLKKSFIEDVFIKKI